MVSEDVNLYIFRLPLVNTLFMKQQHSSTPYKPGFCNLKDKKTQQRDYKTHSLDSVRLLSQRWGDFSAEPKKKKKEGGGLG